MRFIYYCACERKYITVVKVTLNFSRSVVSALKPHGQVASMEERYIWKSSLIELTK